MCARHGRGAITKKDWETLLYSMSEKQGSLKIGTVDRHTSCVTQFAKDAGSEHCFTGKRWGLGLRLIPKRCCSI